jgi:hypothetical protein
MDRRAGGRVCVDPESTMVSNAMRSTDRRGSEP